MRLIYTCLSVILLTGVFVSCNDDPEVNYEKEEITSVTITLKRTSTDPTPFIISWDDSNLNKIADEGEITSSGVLLTDESYTATIGLMNETNNVSVSAKDHIFCFEVITVDVAVSRFNTDSNGQRFGLTSTWATGDASAGTINIKLRHQPGFKTGDCPLPGDPTPGETDVDLTFEVEVEGAE